MPIAEAVNYYTNPKGEKVPIDLYYTIEGPENGEVVVYVTGLGCQLIHTTYNNFVAPLVAKGYRVLRFDNRDSGHSTRLDDIQPQGMVFDKLRNRWSDQSAAHQLNYPLCKKKGPIMEKKVHHLPQDFTECDYEIIPGTKPAQFMDNKNELPTKAQYPVPETGGFWNAIRLGKKPTAYDLADLAMDTILLCNYLNIDKFHIQGVSMGGMVSQYVAALIPSRILSLSLIMTSTGNTNHNAAFKFLFNTFISRRPPKPDAPIQQWIDFTKETQTLIGLPDLNRTYNNGRNPDRLVEQIISRVPRNESSLMRQMECIDGQEARDYILDYLAARMPIFIFHGKQDQLVPYTNLNHFELITTASLQRQLNPPEIKPRDENDIAPKPELKQLEIIEQEYGGDNNNRCQLKTIIGNKYQNRNIFTTLVSLDNAAHDITDDFAQYLVPTMLSHFDASMGRIDIMLPRTIDLTPQWGEEDDLLFNCPQPQPKTTTETAPTTTETAPTTTTTTTEGEEIKNDTKTTDDDSVLVESPTATTTPETTTTTTTTTPTDENSTKQPNDDEWEHVDADKKDEKDNNDNDSAVAPIEKSNETATTPVATTEETETTKVDDVKVDEQPDTEAV